MKILNIIEGDCVVHIQELPGGDLEIIGNAPMKNPVDLHGAVRSKTADQKTIIPKSKFMECAEFFAQLHNQK